TGGQAVTESLSQEQTKQAAKHSRKTQLEARFLETWRRMFPSLPAPVMQHKFHPTRKWRWDFSWPDQLLAVEIQGGAFWGGRHTRGAEQAKDYEKQREAVKLGWRVLPFNTKDLDDVVSVVECVVELLTNAREIRSQQCERKVSR